MQDDDHQIVERAMIIIQPEIEVESLAELSTNISLAGIGVPRRTVCRPARNGTSIALPRWEMGKPP